MSSKPKSIIVTIEDSEGKFPPRDFETSWPDEDLPLGMQADNARMLFGDAIEDYLGEHNMGDGA